VNKVESDAALQALPPAELKPGDDNKLRYAEATFTLATGEDELAGSSGNTAKLETVSTGRATPSAAAPSVEETPEPEHTLLALLLDSRQGFWGLMFLAACLGAAHALTPGHGKTLVAAYLVGERGTFAHASLLGLVTTLTHTGAVFALVVALLFCFPQAVPRDVQVLFGLLGGLFIAGMGLWLLLRRLSGGADHFHLGGHGHRHRHGPAANNSGNEHEHVHPLPDASQAVGLWGLIGLGVSGGIVPCWDAIVMVGFAVSAQRLWLGLPLLLAFSAGLASVLIAIGIGVVYLKGFASSRWGESRLIRALPLISAVLVTGMGLWLCYESVHSPAVPAQSLP
jgi:ABC-type nickel/cobalt efflux system permease component RcnA